MTGPAELNRPMKFGPGNRKVYVDHNNEALQAENDANGNAIFIGRAPVGTLVTAAEWQIQSIAYDANNSVTSITWPQNADANATENYQFVWNDRATQTFS